MKIKNKWYWLDEDFEWNRYPKEVQILLKKQTDKYETKLTIDNKDYIFNFKEKYDLEIKTGDMVTIKNEFYNELDKIERNIKEQKKLRLDQHIHHNQLKRKKEEFTIDESDESDESDSIDESDDESDEEWIH